MIKSVRINDELAERLERAARVLDVTSSELIRDAVARRCDEVLGSTLADRLAPVVGVVESDGGRAERTGGAFERLLRERRGR